MPYFCLMAARTASLPVAVPVPVLVAVDVPVEVAVLVEVPVPVEVAVEVEVPVEVLVAVLVEVDVAVLVAVLVPVEVAVEVAVEVPVEVEVAVDVEVLVTGGLGLGTILSHGITTTITLAPHILPPMMRINWFIIVCRRSSAFCCAGSPVGSGTSTTFGGVSVSSSVT